MRLAASGVQQATVVGQARSLHAAVTSRHDNDASYWQPSDDVGVTWWPDIDDRRSVLTERTAMSRVQLALRVADLEAADRLLLPPVRHQPGQAPPRLRQLRHRRAAAEAGPARGRGRARRPAWTTSASRSRTTDLVAAATDRLAGAGTRHPGRGQHHLLLRRPGQGLGHRPRRRAVGGLHRHRRRAPRPRGQDRASSCPTVGGDGTLLHHHPHQYGDRPGAHRHRCLLLSNGSPPQPGCRPGPGAGVRYPSCRTAIAR